MKQCEIWDAFFDPTLGKRAKRKKTGSNHI